MLDSLVNYSTIRSANRLDAEYFAPKFLQQQVRLEGGKFRRLEELCEFIQTGPAGSEMPASRYSRVSNKLDSWSASRNDKIRNLRVYRPSNLNGWSCNEGSLVYVSSENYNNKFSGMAKKGNPMPSVKLYKAQDLLITRVGDIKFGIIEDSERVAISPNMIALRVKKNLLDPYFLLAFFNSKFGYEQIKRGQRKVSLASITTSDIANVQVPVVSIKEQIKIGNLVRDGLKKQREAIKMYNQNDGLLLKEIYGERPLPNPLLRGEGTTERSGILNLSKLREVRRADAEYFLSFPENSEYSVRLKSSGKSENQNNQIRALKLSEIVEIHRGIEVGRGEYREKGALFLRTSNIGKFGLLDKSQKYISKDIYKKLYKKYQPEVGEILLVKDGKPGVACIVKKAIKGIISEGVVRLVINNKFSAEYIWVCLNSEFCQKQVRQNIEGTLAPHLKIDQLRDILIPIVSYKMQKEITRLGARSARIFQEGEGIMNKISKINPFGKLRTSDQISKPNSKRKTFNF